MSGVAGTVPCIECGESVEFRVSRAGGDACEFWGAPCHTPEYWEVESSSLTDECKCPKCGHSYEDDSEWGKLMEKIEEVADTMYYGESFPIS